MCTQHYERTATDTVAYFRMIHRPIRRLMLRFSLNCLQLQAGLSPTDYLYKRKNEWVKFSAVKRRRFSTFAQNKHYTFGKAKQS